MTINTDGSFSYTSFSGEPDLFVYQVCDEHQTECSDGCNQGVVYINSANCGPPSNGGGYVETMRDCVEGTGDAPQLLTFRYTGKDCSASNHAQGAGMVKCFGDPQMASEVYVTAMGDKTYFKNLKVSLDGTFSIDAAGIGEDKLKSSTIVYLKDAKEQILQIIEMHTSGSQPLRVGDQFAGLLLEGYLSKQNVTCGQPDLENRHFYDCVKETGGHPKLLTFRYTGENCSASNHAQDLNKVYCSGDPMFAPLVYITAFGDQTYFTDLEVALNGTFSIDAARVGEDKLTSTTTFHIKDANGVLLQEVELHTAGSQPLGTYDQFGSLVLEGYLSKDNITCGNPDLQDRDILDCKKDVGEHPRLLTFRYSGQGCSTMEHSQDPNKVLCNGDPGFAQVIYVTAIGGKEDYYLLNREVALGSTFSIDAASVGENKLKSTTTFYLQDADGNLLQTVELKTGGDESLGVNDQFASLTLVGYLGEFGGKCGRPRIPTSEGDCCDYTGKAPQILSFQYTGDGCASSDHNQDPGKVHCMGDPSFAPFVYITAESPDSKNKIFFRDLQVPLNGIFDVDAATIGEKKFKKSLKIYLKDAYGNLLQEIEFNTSCSEPLGAGNQFGALLLKGYVAENGALCGDPPVSEVCNPTSACTAVGKRSAIGLMYLGAVETTVSAFSKSGGSEFLGSYQQVGPGDFIVFSSLYRDKNNLGHFFLQWAAGQEVETARFGLRAR